MSSSTDIVLKVPTKSTQDGQRDDNVFASWRNRKESINPPAAGGLKPADMSRRKSNLRDLTHLSTMRLVPGIRRMTISMRAKSDISADMIKPQVKKENTYKMKPDDGTQFSPAKVHKVVSELLNSELCDTSYDHDTSCKLLCYIAEKIKDKVKDLNFVRYKVAVNVMIGQTADQGMEVASRCVWDDKTDNSVSVVYKNNSLFVIALVFGVYFE